MDVLADKTIELGWERKLGIILDVARGMDYLHHLRPPIIHRDLKSPNLLVTQLFRVKVADFGQSRSVTRTQTMTHAVGTPIWSSPEVLKKNHYTEKADVYSFGIVMWEVLTRDVPYADINQFQIIVEVVRGLRPRIPVDTPKPWYDIMTASWQEEAQRRPAFSQIVRDIEAIHPAALKKKHMKRSLDTFRHSGSEELSDPLLESNEEECAGSQL